MICLINIRSRDYGEDNPICTDSFYVQSDCTMDVAVKAALIDYCHQENYSASDIDNIWIENFNPSDKTHSIILTDNDCIDVEINGLLIEVNGDITGTTKVFPRKIMDIAATIAATLPDNCNFEKDDIQKLFDSIEECYDNE